MHLMNQTFLSVKIFYHCMLLELVNELVNILVNLLVDKLGNELVNELVNALVNELVNELVSELVNELVTNQIGIWMNMMKPLGTQFDISLLKRTMEDGSLMTKIEDYFGFIFN